VNCLQGRDVERTTRECRVDARPQPVRVQDVVATLFDVAPKPPNNLGVTARTIGDIKRNNRLGHRYWEIGWSGDVDRQILTVKGLSDLSDVSCDASGGSTENLQDVQTAAHLWFFRLASAVKRRNSGAPATAMTAR
jgi:hypothetical protein